MLGFLIWSVCGYVSQTVSLQDLSVALKQGSVGGSIEKAMVNTKILHGSEVVQEQPQCSVCFAHAAKEGCQ